MLEYDRTDVSAGLEVSKTSPEKYGQEKTPYLDTFHAVFGKKKQKCFVVWEDNEKVMPLQKWVNIEKIIMKLNL